MRGGTVISLGSAGLLINPAFGISPEYSSTGSGGPSIFPSSALALRWNFRPSEKTYWSTAVFNAHAGVPGDHGGIDTSFREGMMGVTEFGWSGEGKFGIGLWGYSRHQDNIRDVDSAGDPKKSSSRGAYLVLEGPIFDGLTGFVKAGISDGRTTDLSGAWQSGVMFEPFFASRPDSSASIGVGQAILSSRARHNTRDVGLDPASAETLFEATYSDRISDNFALQPDLQYILRPGGLRGTKDIAVFTLRLIAEF